MTSVQPPVAIVGMAVLLPGAANLDSYWQNLVNGVDAITDVPANRWDASFYDPEGAVGPPQADRIYCRRGGFVDGLAEIDPTEFGIMPSSVAEAEPDQLIALQVAASAIADAGGAERLPARDRIGVILGRIGYVTRGLVRLEQRIRTPHQLVRTLSELAPDLAPEQLDRIKAAFTEQVGPLGPESVGGLVPALVASRIANRFGFQGPAYTVDAACAASMVAVDQAIGELARERCDLVLAGGVYHCDDVLMWSMLAQLQVLSPSQRMRPFDRAADGLLVGEGTGVVALKRLADAERDGDRIYAVIRGSGMASDGRGGSMFYPEPDGQALAAQRAWQAAGLDPAEPGSIGLLEASGTATPVGDQAELTYLARVFGPPTGERAVLGSVKSMIGHTMSTGGVAGLVKAALAVHHGVLLPTLGCENPHPAMARTRFRTISSTEPWELGGNQRIRRAAVNSFGFGGISTHAVVEQHAGQADVRPLRRPVTVREPERVLRLAADSPAGITALLDADDTAKEGDGCRLGVVGPTPERLAFARRAVANGEPWRGGNDVWFSPQPLLGTRPRGRLAFIFPGLEAGFEPRVDDVAARFGLRMPELSVRNHGRHGAGVLAVGRLLDQALRRLSITPDVVAGQSIGELTAMISAGMYASAAIDEFLESVDLDAIPAPDDLSSAVLGCGADQAADVIAGRAEIVVSHDNSPSSSIVCGPVPAIEELVASLRECGVPATVLPLHSGFHTPMMEPYLVPAQQAADRLRLRPPSVPIWSATTAAPYPQQEAEVRALLVRHLLEPVRLRQLVTALHAAGVRVFVQVGSGKLSSLIDDTLRGKDHLAVAANSARHSGLDQLRRVVTALWVEGGRPLAVDGDPPVSSRPGRQPVKLDLSTPLVSLNGAVPVLSMPSSGSLAGLDQLATQLPIAAELAELLRETADSTAAVIGARAGFRKVQQEFHTVLRVSTETMPYLRDHCFYRQRENWPDEADRWPVVPGTTLVHHMIDAAEQAFPGQRAVAVHNVQLSRWLVATPPVDVPVTVVPEGPGHVKVSIGQYAQAMIELGHHYPTHTPAAWPVDTHAERTPDVTAEEFYRTRWIFHGPRFQGITDLVAQGERHVRAIITAPAAPGGLLDSTGQLAWYWMMSAHTTRRVALPLSIGRIRLFGPHPAAGSRLDSTVRFSDVTETMVDADVQLCRQGQVWAHIEGWRGRRFDSDLETEAAERFPETHTLSRFLPDGWVVLPDRWSDLASRELTMRAYLGTAERADYDRCPPPARVRWLLGRIAVKDAVRRWLWDHGCGPVFPAEVRIREDEAGRLVAAGQHGRMLPPLEISLEHRNEVTRAIAVLNQKEDPDLKRWLEPPVSRGVRW